MANKFLDNTGLSYLWGKIKAGLEAKQNKLTGTQGQMVGFNASGEAVAEDMPNGMIFEENQIEMPISASWDSIAYGNGKFVAISHSGNYAAYSEDGISWTSTTLPFSSNWQAVAYGDGKFIAVTRNSSQFAYSLDGVNWESGTIGASCNFLSITYGLISGDSIYICVGEDGLVGAMLPSFDPIKVNIFNAISGLEENLRAVAYGGGKFVAVVDNSNKAIHSSMGLGEWERATLPLSDSWWAIAYGDGKFVTVANSSSTAAYSNDLGVTWNAVTLPSSGNWRSITYGNGKFVTVASNGKIAYSSDGITWAMADAPSASWYSVTYGADKFVAVASDSTPSTVYSYDGIIWYDSVPAITDFSGTDITSDVADALGVSDKQDKVIGQDSQLAGFDENGNLTPLSEVAMAGSFTLMGEFTTNQKMTAMNGVDLSAQSLFNNFADTDAVSKQYVDRRYFYITIDIPTTGWTDNQQTFTVDGIPADASDHVVMLAQEGATNVAAAEACGIRIVNEAENSLTLKVNSVPEAAFQVNAVVWNILERSPYWM